MFWQCYNFIAAVLIIVQLLFLFQSYKNCGYAIRKAGKKRTFHQPPTLLTVPCKGIDNAFIKNITAVFNLEYRNYYLHFVVEDESDPAYTVLQELVDKLGPDCAAMNIRILIAGKAGGCSQKIHNLLYSVRNAPEDAEVFAFVDSDACIKPDWLCSMVNPLRKDKNGASTGYRWFVPQKKNLASLALSALNAKVASLLGNTHFNQVWGGSMAVKREVFEKTGLEDLWEKAISDDLCLSYAVKKAGLKVEFVPGCLVASYEHTTWAKLFEFARRQFLITRVTMPGTWWFGLFCSVFPVLGLWGGLTTAVIAQIYSVQGPFRFLYWAVPVVFAVTQTVRAILRQNMIAAILTDDVDQMTSARRADIFGTCIWSLLMFVLFISSAFGRTIRWRGIRYKLVSRTETRIVG